MAGAADVAGELRRHLAHTRRREIVVPRQVGEQRVQFATRARGQGASRPVLELLLREAASLEVLAQLGDRLIALGVRHPDVATREAADPVVHG
jgi:hypothetical protein